MIERKIMTGFCQRCLFCILKAFWGLYIFFYLSRPLRQTQDEYVVYVQPGVPAVVDATFPSFSFRPAPACGFFLDLLDFHSLLLSRPGLHVCASQEHKSMIFKRSYNVRGLMKTTGSSMMMK